jgi:hypothetical protein
MHPFIPIFAGAALFAATTSASALTLSVGPESDCDAASIADALRLAEAYADPHPALRLRSGVYPRQQLRVRNRSLVVSGGFESCAADAVQNGVSVLEGDRVESVLTLREDDGDEHRADLDHLVIRGGGGGGDGLGGGIDAHGRWTLHLRDVEISANSAELNGGGIAIDALDATPRLLLGERVRVRDNVAFAGDGGGVYAGRAEVEFAASAELRDNLAFRGGGISLAATRVSIGTPAMGGNLALRDDDLAVLDVPDHDTSVP